MSRTLTTAQHSRLNKVEPDAKVVGWHPLNGPIIRRADERKCSAHVHPRNHYHWITPLGRLLPVAGSVLKEATSK